LPFCHLHIKVLRCPYPTRWKCTQEAPAQPRTIGEHLKKVRIERHLFQQALAKLLKVDRGTIQNWERGITTPAIQFIPRIIGFLGYDPEPEAQSVPQRIANARRRLGFTQEDLAEALNVCPVTVWHWETGRSVPSEADLNKLQHLLDGDKGPGITRQ